MKISGCVVFYNPTAECIKNISSYYGILDKLYILDNSPAPLPQSAFSAYPKAEYIPFCRNIGIAGALKKGLALAVEGGYDFCLTMDQDSVFPPITREEAERRLSIKDISLYGIIGLNFNGYGKGEGLVQTDCWLTSGNFINVENYKKTSGFMEELFIDYVDFRLCEQFAAIGKKVAYYADLSLTHTIGNPIQKRIFGKTVTAMNHSPVRYYYRYRNALYLYRRNKKFYGGRYRHDLYIDTLKMLLFEKNRLLKLKMIKKGRKDAKRSVLGEYRP